MGGGGGGGQEIKFVDIEPQTVETTTDAYRQQLQLGEIAQAQNQENMRLGAELDRTNAEFFQTQNLRGIRAQGAETRMNLAAQGAQTRLNIGAQGEQTRLNIGTEGRETRATRRVEGEEQRRGIVTTGEQTRLTRETEGQQQRLGIQEQTRGTQAIRRTEVVKRDPHVGLKVKSNVQEFRPLALSNGKLFAPQVKKLGQLSCNVRCSVAIKRTGITSRRKAKQEHDGMDSRIN